MKLYPTKRKVIFAALRARYALAEHATSVQLENHFWRVLEAIAIREKLTLPQLLNKLNEEYTELRKQPPSNFASMLRVGCLRFVKHYPDII